MSIGRIKLTIQESGKDARVLSVPEGVSLFEAASWNGIAIDSTCGGHGTCKKCKVKIDNPPNPTALDSRAFNVEELREGWRLACVQKPITDTTVFVPPLTTRPKAATVGVGRQVILRPAVQKRYLELSEPTLHDQRTDIERVLAGVVDIEATYDFEVLRTLPQKLRKANFKITTVFVDNELIDVEAGDTTEKRYAIAFDLGTTTVVATLLDLTTGTPVAVKSMLNKQQPFGADVISRISATMLDPLALPKLQELAQSTLRELTAEVCSDIDPQFVYEVAIAGNATMTHLLLGVDPESLGVAPFIMASASFDGITAADLNLTAVIDGFAGVHPRAKAFIMPSLGAYIGGDIISGALASGMDRDKRLRLFIDVGTNCEIILGDGERIMATAAPAGPAFEAASIKCGMRAAAGAIETVRVEQDDLVIGTIDNSAAIGICGSGLVDACASLVDIGLLDHSGKFVSDESAKSIAPKLAPRLTTRDGERVFMLTDEIFLSQRDVRELQFAKAAIATGWALLLEDFGVAESDVQQVLLAGSFGSYLSASSAIRIGLVPKLATMRIVSAGNVAGEGAKMALLSLQERSGARSLMTEMDYVELSDRTDFNDKFVERLAFPN